MKRIKIGIRLDWRDWWVGVYRRRISLDPSEKSILQLFICIIPCLPISLTFSPDADDRSEYQRGK